MLLIFRQLLVLQQLSRTYALNLNQLECKIKTRKRMDCLFRKRFWHPAEILSYNMTILLRLTTDVLLPKHTPRLKRKS